MIALDRALLARVTDAGAMSDRLGLTVSSAEVVRHKPGRRCLVRYDTAGGLFYGKVRIGHRPAKAYELAEALWRAGLRPGNPSAVAVAEPIAVFDDLAMWVQRAAPGAPADFLLGAGALPPGVVGERAAEAAVRIHLAGVAARRAHGVDDELEVLHKRFSVLAAGCPSLARRLERIFAGCRARADAHLRSARPCRGIHRDFYADQLLIAGDLVTVVDFDLYCRGDPALDIGNFVAHLIEAGLRLRGDVDAWSVDAERCVTRFVELAGAEHRRAIEAYTDLTLARHISLSTELPGRSPTTAALLDLCEQRVDRPLR